MKLFSFILTSLLLVNTLLTAEAPTSWVIGTEYDNGSYVTYGKNTYKALKDVPESVGGYPNTLIDYWININKLMPGLDHNTSLAYPKGVKVASGNAYYISIADYIPVGISITNTNYWEQTNFNFDKDEANTLNIPNSQDIDLGNLTPPTSVSSVFGISCRAYIDDAPMVGGLTIRGSESKLVLVRAKGPSMQSVLPGKKMLPNPKIKIQKLNEETGVYSTVLQTNDYGDHESASAYSSEATGNDLEPMIVTSLEPGVYSIKVQDQTSGETGNANLEIYGLNDDNSSSYFFGLSGRAYISDAPMVGGLTIKGSESIGNDSGQRSKYAECVAW